MKILLDTNAYSAFFRGTPGVREILTQAERIYMSVFVVGELLHGFRSGTMFERNSRGLRAFLDSPRVSFLPATLLTADRFSRIADRLRGKGTPIPTNDIWIAAHSFEVGADLVSYDKHFADVEGLAVIAPGILP